MNNNLKTPPTRSATSAAHAMPRTAEDVLAGHPDRLCDAVAEAIVTHACSVDDEALVGVEVALHRHFIAITGRVAASNNDRPWLVHALDLSDEALDQIVREQFETAAYVGAWAHRVRVVSDLDVGELLPDERAIRRYSDDQGIAVGYADPTGPNMIPVEAFVARSIKEALADAVDSSDEDLGPDGKVLVRLSAGDRPLLGHINLAIQHRPGLGFEHLHRLIAPFLEERLGELHEWVDIPERLDGSSLRLNGIGDFTCGGPLGDNGLSGKKLVVDHYGPHVPIGGGALCGKDVHKPDRVGALRARQLAVRLARVCGTTATVHLGWLPGLEEPDRLWAQLGDGRVLDADAIAGLITIPDLSLAGSARELSLRLQDWAWTMRLGYFGRSSAWEN